MKKLILVCCLIAFGVMLSACTAASNGKPKDTTTLKLSYKQYRALVSSASKHMEFHSVPLSFTRTTLNSPISIMVTKEMTFGKRKKFLTRNDEPVDSLQEQIVYENRKDGYTLVTSWVYTDTFLDNNLLMLKPPEESNIVFDNIVSYRNILIHVQVLPYTESHSKPEELSVQNAKIIIELNRYLDNYMLPPS